MAMALHSHSLLCSGRTARRLVPLFVFSTHRPFPRPRTVYFRTSESLLTTQVHDISCRRLTAKAAADEVFSAPELSKNFDFTAEERIYNWWESQGYFKPNIDLDKPPFVISMPPPNVTGALHMGHAMFVTLEDIMTRYWRMKGRPTLWLPGTDHAGIATQLTAFKVDLAAQITATMCMYRKNVDSMQTDAKAIALALLAYVGRGSQFIIV